MLKELEQAKFSERRFDSGEIVMNYAVGPPNGPPLVLIPAQMGIWLSYRPNLPALSRLFQVYAIDVRGHGKSQWTTGDYSWASVGRDMRAFLSGVVRQPALISGNSSGGLIALWCAANVPDLVSGIILEDAPVFSAEMPRFKERDRFVYNGLKHLVEQLGDVNNRDLADYLRGQTLPVDEGRRQRRIPDRAVAILSFFLRRHEERHPGEPVDVPFFPWTLRMLFKSLSQFDPDFARAFVDRRFYEGLDHAQALSRVLCPLLVMHASWFRHPDYGLVGAMDAADADRIRELAPHADYVQIPANHVIHLYEADQFNAAVIGFAARHGLLLQPARI